MPENPPHEVDFKGNLDTVPHPHPCSHRLYSSLQEVRVHYVNRPGISEVKPTSISSVTFTSLPDMAWGQSISSGVSRPTTLLPPGLYGNLNSSPLLLLQAWEIPRGIIWVRQLIYAAKKAATTWSHMPKWRFLSEVPEIMLTQKHLTWKIFCCSSSRVSESPQEGCAEGSRGIATAIVCLLQSKSSCVE